VVLKLLATCFPQYGWWTRGAVSEAGVSLTRKAKVCP